MPNTRYAITNDCRRGEKRTNSPSEAVIFTHRHKINKKINKERERETSPIERNLAVTVGMQRKDRKKHGEN